MDYGIALYSHPETWKTARRAEELGFKAAWFYDSQLIASDLFAMMALAAVNTSRIRLGTGVLVPTNRIAPVAAAGLATLNQLAPGRIDFGVGTGFTARNTMGLGPQPLARMAEYLDVVMPLLRGETAKWRAEGSDHDVRFLHPDHGFVNVKDPVALHISAFGPRGRALTAELADGWITFTGTAERAAGDVAQLDEALRAAGRDPASLQKTAFTLGCVLAEGEAPDSPRAMAQAGPMASTGWHGMMERMDAAGIEPEPGTPAAAYREIYRSSGPDGNRYLHNHTGHLLFVREEERPFVTGEMIRSQTFTGTAAELRDYARAVAAAGYTQLVVQLVPGHEEAVEDWARVFDLV